MDAVDEELTYNDLFVKFPGESSASIGAAYDAIEQLLTEAETYFQVIENHRISLSMVCHCLGLVEISSSLGSRTQRCLSTIGNEHSIMVRLFERYQVSAAFPVTLSGKTRFFPPVFRESRKTLDTQETYKAFGPLIIDFSKIQSKIGVKYDNWHQDLLRKFGQIIQTVATDFHTNISEVFDLFRNLFIERQVSLSFSIKRNSKRNRSNRVISRTVSN